MCDIIYCKLEILEKLNYYDNTLGTFLNMEVEANTKRGAKLDSL